MQGVGWEIVKNKKVVSVWSEFDVFRSINGFCSKLIEGYF